MKTTGQPIDINPTHLKMIQSILDEHVPDCEVRAFGSRAKWSASDYSDLDLAVVGDQPLEWRALGRLKDALEESTLPFRVDVLDWHDISDNFREIIRGDCTVIKIGNQLSEPSLNKWPTNHFGDCATLIRESISPSSVGDVPYIGLEHIGEGTLSLVDHGVASDVTSTKSSFKQGDILFGKLRPYFRKVTRAPFDGICSTDIWVVRAKDGIDQEFLFYCMASEAFVDFATNGSEGTRMPRAKWEYVSRYKLPVPTLHEQQKISYILRSLDEKIELNRRMNETLETIAQALFRSWFVNFDPIRAKMEGRWRPGESLPGLPAHLYDIFPDRLIPSDLGDMPEGWHIKPLDEIAIFKNGLALQKYQPQEKDERLPVVKISQLRNGIADSGEWATASIDPACIINDGDIIFSWSGSLITKIWCGGKAALNQHLFKVTPTKLSKWFIWHCVCSHLADFKLIAASKATTMGHIKRHHLSDARCVIPDNRVLTKADDIQSAIFNTMISLNIQIRHLINARNILISKLTEGTSTTPCTQFQTMVT